MPAADLLVPGDPATPTGGYLYDRRIVEGLSASGWATAVHALDASFPLPSADALAAAAATLASLPDGRATVVDGLALAGLATVLPAAAERLRLVALVHHPLADETGLDTGLRDRLRRQECAALELVERIVVTSRWTARRLTADGVSEQRIRIVEPGTDRPALPSPRDVPASGGGARDPIRLLCVGTLIERKGHAVLLDALAELRDLPWRLDCAGSATRQPAIAAGLRQRIERLGLERRVTLHGELPQDALEDLYARADVFVLPSYLEGYGMALAEAVARGLPVVSTTAGAIPETVPPEAALLVAPGDAQALAEALRAITGNAALRRMLAARAVAARDRLPSWVDAAAAFATAIGDLAQ